MFPHLHLHLVARIIYLKRNRDVECRFLSLLPLHPACVIVDADLVDNDDGVLLGVTDLASVFRHADTRSTGSAVSSLNSFQGYAVRWNPTGSLPC